VRRFCLQPRRRDDTIAASVWTALHVEISVNVSARCRSAPGPSRKRRSADAQRQWIWAVETYPATTARCARERPLWAGARRGIDATLNRLKDFRRIATRHDKLARNYLAAVCLAAVLVCGFNESGP
jgi:hypothetical protein